MPLPPYLLIPPPPLLLTQYHRNLWLFEQNCQHSYEYASCYPRLWFLLKVALRAAVIVNFLICSCWEGMSASFLSELPTCLPRISQISLPLITHITRTTPHYHYYYYQGLKLIIPCLNPYAACGYFGHWYKMMQKPEMIFPAVQTFLQEGSF